MSSRAATPARTRLGGDRLALRPFADDHQPRLFVGHGRDGANQARQVLDRAQAGDGADHDLVPRARKAGDRALDRRLAIVGDGDPVGDAHDPLRRLPPGPARDPLQPLRRHDQPVGAAQAEAAVEVALGIELDRLVLVEAVLVMDQRRAAAATAAPSPHRTTPNYR